MQAQAIARIEQRIRRLQKRLAELGPVMRGTVVMLGRANKHPYFSLNRNGKTRLIYLGRKRETQARAYSENYKKLRNIVDEMTELNMLLLKKDYAAARAANRR
jgi:hypothetical protein